MSCSKMIIIVSAITALAVPMIILAEERGQPHPEESFIKNCPTIFVGKVAEVNSERMPTNATVFLSIKGNAAIEDRKILPKSRGKFVIFKEEFDDAKKGQIAIFFLGPKKEGAVLQKFKVIPGVIEDTKAKSKKWEGVKSTFDSYQFLERVKRRFDPRTIQIHN